MYAVSDYEPTSVAIALYLELSVVPSVVSPAMDDGDEGGDQSILDCRRAAPILEQSPD